MKMDNLLVEVRFRIPVEVTPITAIELERANPWISARVWILLTAFHQVACGERLIVDIYE